MGRHAIKGQIENLKCLGGIFKALIDDLSLKQDDVIAALPVGLKFHERTLRRYLTGKSRIGRDELIVLLVRVFHQTDAALVDRALELAGYVGLTEQEVTYYKLSRLRPLDTDKILISLPERQAIIWGLNKKALVSTSGCGLSSARGMKSGLLFVRPLPSGLRFDDKKLWDICFKTKLYNGLIRVTDTYLLFQVFQRYSDGSYRRLS